MKIINGICFGIVIGIIIGGIIGGTLAYKSNLKNAIRSCSDLPYFSYTMFEEHLIFRMNENCSRLRSAIEGYNYYSCNLTKAQD